MAISDEHPVTESMPSTNRRTQMELAARWTARIVGAGLLGATAGIHASLYNTGYSSIPKIGPMFLALVIVASIFCLAVLAVPQGRFLALAAAVGALIEAGTAIALVVFTNYTIFDFRESTQAMYYRASLGVEIAGFIVLGGLAAWAFTRRSPSR
jgi:uncharacterized protein (DUF486 family)